jgi:hypothetical protein
MSIFQGNRYHFHRSAQWRAGALDNFAVKLADTEASLSALAGLGFLPVPGTVDVEGDALPAVDPCGYLYWLRSATGELVRYHAAFGNETVAVLAEAQGADAFVIGVEVYWVLARGEIGRYSAATLQLLGTLPRPSAGRILAIAGGGGDGLWVLESAPDNAAILRRYDALGCGCGPQVRIDNADASARVASTRNGAQVVVLARGAEPGRDDVGRPSRTWRLIVVDGADGSKKVYQFTAAHGDPLPQLIVIDWADNIHLFERPIGPPLVTYDLEGERVAHRSVPIPSEWKTISALAASDRIVIATPHGLAWLSEDQLGEGENDEIVSTFITPTLVSPDGLGNRWNSADLDVVMAAGTAVEISVAATRDPSEIAQINRLFQRPPEQRFAALNDAIRWRQDRTTRYVAESDEPVREKLRVLLDGLTQTNLWLRVQFRVLAGGSPPRLAALKVFYPEHSYLEFLPAVYRENPAAAAQLRRFLAPVEALFDEIDDEIDALPRRIDPQTAPASLASRTDSKPVPSTWQAFLLRWLGFPDVESLDAGVVKALLAAAPALLKGRGTLAALQQVLDIVTGQHARIEDNAALPGPWILAANASLARGPRLGRDTLAVAANRRPLQLGCGTPLGAAPLNEFCVDPVGLLTARTGLITIIVGLNPAARERLEPMIRSFLALFVPAQCRVQLEIVTTARWRARVALGAGLRLATEGEPTSDAARLADEAGGRLGRSTDLGCWALPVPAISAGVLDRTAIINGAQRLS